MRELSILRFQSWYHDLRSLDDLDSLHSQHQVHLEPCFLSYQQQLVSNLTTSSKIHKISFQHLCWTIHITRMPLQMLLKRHLLRIKFPSIFSNLPMDYQLSSWNGIWQPIWNMDWWVSQLCFHTVRNHYIKLTLNSWVMLQRLLNKNVVHSSVFRS